MLDWRILAASFVALLFISGLFITGFGIKDFITNIGEKIGEWTSSSPFGGFFSTTPKKTHQVEIIFYPESIRITPQTPIDITSGSLNLENFQGTVNVSFSGKSIILKEQQTDLKIELILNRMVLENIKLASFTAGNASFEIKPDIKTSKGTIDMTDFSGKVLLDEKSITFIGNVSILKTRIGDRNWELK
jgi:hypothetical protein